MSLLIKNKAYDPTKANTTAGIPNLIKTSLLNCFPIIESLNILKSDDKVQKSIIQTKFQADSFKKQFVHEDDIKIILKEFSQALLYEEKRCKYVFTIV